MRDPAEDEPKTKTMLLRLDEKTYEALKAQAATEHTAMMIIVRRALRRELDVG